MAQMQWLRKYDLYQKIPADLSEGTNAGGCISVIAISLIIYLIMQETSHFLNPPVMTRLRHDDPVTREEMKYIPIESESPWISPSPDSLVDS